MSDDLDQLCDDILARAQAFAAEAERLKRQPKTPEQREAIQKLQRDSSLLLQEIRQLQQTRQAQ